MVKVWSGILKVDVRPVDGMGVRWDGLLGWFALFVFVG